MFKFLYLKLSGNDDKYITPLFTVVSSIMDYRILHIRNMNKVLPVQILKFLITKSQHNIQTSSEVFRIRN